MVRVLEEFVLRFADWRWTGYRELLLWPRGGPLAGVEEIVVR